MLERVIKDLLTWSCKTFGLVTLDQSVLRFGFLDYLKAFFICGNVKR